MILRLSVLDTADSSRQDVEVIAEPASSVASLLAALPFKVGNRPCYVDGVALLPGDTIGDSSLITGATITIGSSISDRRRRLSRQTAQSNAVGTFRAVSGVDVGLAVDLGAGEHLIGRDQAAAVRLSDKEVSRRHATLKVTADGSLTITDLDSSNGTAVNGAWLIPSRPERIGAGDAVDLAGGRFEWQPKSLAPQLFTRSRDGRLDFDRAFAPAPEISTTTVKAPQLDSVPRNIATVVLSSLLPVVLGVVMAVVMRQPTMLLFAVFGPVMGIGTYLMERRQRRKREAVFAEQVTSATKRIDEAVALEESVLRQLSPDQAELTAIACRSKRGLWPRNADSPDALTVRIGTGDQPASLEVQGEPWPDYEEPTLRDVPVTVDLRAAGVFGVVGEPKQRDGLVRWLLVQLATLRSPDDLRLVVLSSRKDAALAWTQWLPHLDVGESGNVPCWIGNTPDTRTARIEELKDLVEARMAKRPMGGEVRFDDDTVVLLDGALALRNLPGMKEILRDGPSVGVYAICADDQDMNECRGLARLDGDGRLRLVRSRRDHPCQARPEGMDPQSAEQIARSLAPMRDRLTLAGAQAAMPYPVRMVDLFDADVHTAEGVAALWNAQPGPTTQIVLGADGSGHVSVDLARQGPHTMLAGATGAGKSVLLQTLVTALLLANRPDEMNLILVDFKGGGAFLPFKDCPHVVSLIRSTGETPADVFDAAAAARVLDSVRSEVNRRESLLAPYGGELDVYWRARRDNPGLAPLPRLIMIFDEYARVLETSPEFLKELVNVAAKGRSLGMHLVLATQSLQGKLSAELKNNISLRITLRQNEPAESVEVLGVPDAATIPGRLRGRGMILSTNDETRTPRLFQSGYLGDPPPVEGATPATVRVINWSVIGTPRPEEEAERSSAATDLDLTIAAIVGAARAMGVTAPFQPLLPPLPATLALGELPSASLASVTDSQLPFGLTDDPVGQAQPAACLDLAGTERILVAGGPQSGRTTFARTLITSLATQTRPDRVHLYIVERAPSGLDAYSGLPHCGAVFGPAEPDRLRRFVVWLHGEVERRSIARYTSAGQSAPTIVVIIDGWEYFEDRSNPAFVETSTLLNLREIITMGTPLGIHVVAIGGQDMMNGKLPNLYPRRLLLPFPKEDVRRHNLSPGLRKAMPPVIPGRAIDAATGLHTHICHPGRPEPLHLPTVDPAALPREFRPMPVRIPVDDLTPSGTWTPIGIGGPDVAPIGIDLFEAGPHLVLISGPPGSGRTTAAAAIAHQLRRVNIGVLALAPPRSPLSRLLPADLGVHILPGTTFKDTDLIETAATFGDRPYAVILDDCEQITVVPAQEGFSEKPTLLQDIANPGSLGRRALILCGNAAPIIEGQRRSLARVVGEVMTGGTRILLTPTSPPNARLHGFTLEPDQYFAGPPGRAYLATGRTPDLIHLATLNE